MIKNAKIVLFSLAVIFCIENLLLANTGDFIRNILSDIRARGRCRRIVADKNIVHVHFMNSDDAKIFAEDLSNLINDEE